ncbi:MULTISPECIES: SDR family NAD(P)-dependent oxidoreductase [unclassified Paracoccus (in: a-proteobacteria)]|uniref:SDR family NAD(P)-dependent oxidoreductase n=1 Tax=unclassified Paracoccus (in: a-proteobacteria) TaxID=2688777 RepID=UPI00160298DC|nr:MULTISPECIES: SDR family NAD(P)-dependent oxidoreductase [unclassified Paracoccus (in: a-proteobacteria)]MBB1491430.1 SDR family NAD(P)-dependent oxidoreductase [Paracoccus sp. MC1854]MBB1497686.1 SDR family NAD(P)-dependent oxidoreductase [Paracoccus sp. MC1862]QQO44121.1 SDR family NAD(P)-dependent oxidoreductase [Paracoccus sp. MC1862]
MTEIKSATALVTGGASGIGLLVTRRMFAAGAARVALWDIDAAALDRAVAGFHAEGLDVTGTRLDLSRPDEIAAAVAEAEAQGLAPDILLNNAGIVLGKPFAVHTEADIRRTMEVNAIAPMLVARAFLPGMVARGRGHIVNIASAAGMLSNPNMSVYCASKWALIGWSDSLRLEMQAGRTGVRVTTVTPTYIDTGMFAGAKLRLIPVLRPEAVADAILRAIRRDRIFLRLPGLVNFLPFLKGIMPVRAFDALAGRLFGIYGSMDRFRGRE